MTAFENYAAVPISVENHRYIDDILKAKTSQNKVYIVWKTTKTVPRKSEEKSILF